MSNQQIDALVVGAGPVGLTVAVSLTHHGLKCRIIDKASEATDKSKALVVWCRTLELLDQFGLASGFVASGHKAKGGTMYANGQKLVHIELTSDESAFGFPLMIPQSETERLLTEHLSGQGLNVERPVELVSFEEQSDSIICKLRSPDGQEEICETPWLIGCDGAHSAVRHGSGMPFTGHAEPNDWMLADIHVDGPLATDEVSVFWHESGVLVFFPITRDRFRVIADIGAASEHAPPPQPTLADVQAKVDERGPGGLTLSDPVWLSNFRINERKVRDYRKGRALLTGDAAHIHSPAGGQGMNTGMQDAFNLAWKLALIQRGHGRTEPLIESYSTERSAVGEQVLANAERFTTIATLRNPAAQWVRNQTAAIIGAFPFVRDRIRDALFELSINYRHSALSAQKWPSMTGGLAAGDRLCDAPVRSPVNGTHTTLFSVIGCLRINLLVFPGSGDAKAVAHLLQIAEKIRQQFPTEIAVHVIVKADDAGAGGFTGAKEGSVWIDTNGILHQKLYATDASLFLIRPDGYIGFRCQPAESDATIHYLDGFLTHAK
jgi:2-polyprenyl-6-methoxyphenol hydroxylase-like FAD-dependent oxidoreductase